MESEQLTLFDPTNYDDVYAGLVALLGQLEPTAAPPITGGLLSPTCCGQQGV